METDSIVSETYCLYLLQMRSLIAQDIDRKYIYPTLTISRPVYQTLTVLETLHRVPCSSQTTRHTLKKTLSQNSHKTFPNSEQWSTEEQSPASSRIV